MNMRPLLFSCLIALTLTACEKVEEPTGDKADPALVKVSLETAIPSTTYDEGGLLFDYPSDWTVLEDSVQDSVRYIFIESSDEALSIIQIFRKDEAPSLEDFSLSYSEQTQVAPTVSATNDSNVDVQPSAALQSDFMAITRDLNGVAYEWIVETIPGSESGVNTNDYREYFRKDSERFSAFLVNQVDKTALDKHEGSFEMIFRTLQPMQ